MIQRKERYLQVINYLKEYSKLRERTVYNIEGATKYKTIIWVDDVPDCDGINSPIKVNNRDADFLLSLVRPIEPLEPTFPIPAENLNSWIDESTLRNHEDTPILLPFDEEEEMSDDFDYEDIIALFEEYLEQKWNHWAIAYKKYLPIKAEYDLKKELYFKLFEAYNKVKNFPEAFELVVGVGLFKYCSKKQQFINRHIVNFKLDIEFLKGKITLFLRGDENSLSIETEMLSPLVEEGIIVSEASNHLKNNIVQQELFESISSIQLDEALSGFSTLLSANAVFNSSITKPAKFSTTPTVTLSPAIILREKSQKGYAQVYEQIFSGIKTGDADKIPLLDAFIGIETPTVRGNSSDNTSLYLGAKTSQEIVFPKKYNEEQVKIIQQTRVKNRVLVQGPPGTGKSHTIANLICNLLGEGKSVLVTAHTNRALEVLINHIPESFHQLVIFLLEIGTKGETTLSKSIKGLQDSLNDASKNQLKVKIESSRIELDRLKRRKADLNNKLLAIIESDTRKIGIAGYGEQSLLEHTKKIKSDKLIHGWWEDEIKELPKTISLVADLLAYKTLTQTIANFSKNPEHFFIPQKEDLISIDNYRLLRNKFSTYQKEFPKIKRTEVIKIPPNSINLLKQLFDLISQKAKIFASDEYYARSYKQLIVGKNAKWVYLFNSCDELLKKPMQAFFEAKKSINCFYPANKSKQQILADTKVVAEYLQEGKSVTGFFKGLTLPKPIKDRKYVYTDISLNNHPITTLKDLNWVIQDLQAQILLEEVGGMLELRINKYDLREYFEVKDRYHYLQNLIEIAEEIETCSSQLSTIFKKPIDYFENPKTLKSLEKFAEAAKLAQEISPLEKEFFKTYKYVKNSTLPIHPRLKDLAERLKKLDTKYYESQLFVIETLRKEQKSIVEKARQKEALSIYFPRLIARMEESDFLTTLTEEKLTKAIYWKNADQKLQTFLSASSTSINQETTLIEDKLLKVGEEFLLNKAILGFINKITSIDGLINLLQKWQNAIEQGKRNGKRAIRYRREARKILSQIRDKIPCWVIPLNRLTETLQPKQATFDYIIIDEASQVGAEGIFLNYIAKNLIIVGDDKQTSPQTVGVKTEEINQLIDTHLQNIPNRDFFGTENSFFDHAKMTSGISIVLKEHFRCMPEIIEFCNQEFYAPEGINLIPLRTFSTSRLVPLKHTFVSTGYTENHINKPEAAALVEAMKKCIANPQYEGKSIGVITLLGNKQANVIEKLIEKEIDTKEILARKIICGKATNFQGDERDVIFLSMISSLSAKGTSILTNKNRKQEYNVAVSRAKDQLWLFHSLQPSDFGYGDLRGRLVTHFYNQKKEDGILKVTIPIIERTNDNFPRPFDSWFEVDVYQQIKRRGLMVFPQYKVGRYSIDLVIMLSNGYKLAVECDGDRYHSGDQILVDIQRQRLLERVGWEFFRIRGSQFYYDPANALEDLWELLKIRGMMEIEQKKEESKPVPQPKPILTPIAKFTIEDKPVTKLVNTIPTL